MPPINKIALTREALGWKEDKPKPKKTKIKKKK